MLKFQTPRFKFQTPTFKFSSHGERRRDVEQNIRPCFKLQHRSNNISSHHVWHCMGYAPCDYGDGLLFAPDDLFIFVMY